MRIGVLYTQINGSYLNEKDRIISIMLSFSYLLSLNCSGLRFVCVHFLFPAA